MTEMNLDGPDPRWRDVAAILLGPLVHKLRGGGETPVAVAAPVTAPAAPHAAAPVGAAGTTPAVPAYGRTDPCPASLGHGAADGHGSQWAGAAGQAAAADLGRTGPSERAGADQGRRGWNRAETCEVPGDAPAPPIGYEPWWYCVTCDDGHIGPCTAGTPRRRPLLLRLLDLIGRPA